MSKTATVQHLASKMNQDSPYDQHVAQQSHSVQVIHRALTLLHGAGLGLVVAIFVKALTVSIRWTEVNVLEIPFWWMVFAASILPFGLFFGLDVILMRAVPPPPIGKGNEKPFTGGYRAVATGLIMIVAALGWAGLNAALGYAVLTFDMDVMETAVSILTTVIGIGAAIHLLSTLWQHVTCPTTE